MWGSGWLDVGGSGWVEMRGQYGLSVVWNRVLTEMHSVQ